jgi:ubiquitin carboxyl-terminal hydrolase L5
VIFLFKYPTGETRGETPKDGTYDHEAANNLFFAAQTIQNACGTQAIVSLLLNREKEVNIGKELKEFKEFAGEFPPEVTPYSYAPPYSVANRTYSYEAKLSQTRTSFARHTIPSRAPHPSSTKPNAQPPKTTTYTTSSRKPFHSRSPLPKLTPPRSYTSINSTLYELDGLQPAPISHGPCTPSQFPAKIIPVLQRRIARYPSSEIRFNLLACVRDLRIRAREIGDEEELEHQEDRRAQWLWENSLRRHNFVGFISELLKGVVKAKLEEGGGAYDKWVEEAKGRSKKRREDLKKQGIASDD